MLEPLPKEITDEIRFILEGCRDGRLHHDQISFHCGTAHCIAGWKAVLDIAKHTSDESIKTKDFELEPGAENAVQCQMLEKDCDNEWDYAELQWRLTRTETKVLFSEFADFDEQFDLLAKLERGERVGDE